jgi:ketosteroid isomerase-like protein
MLVVAFEFEPLAARGRTAIDHFERLTRGAVPVALVIVLGLFASACGRSDPEKELRATVAAMAQAIEKREPAEFLDAVSDDFTRESGAFGKQDARRVLAGVLLRNESVQLSAVVTEVRVEGDRAFAKVRVIATGGASLLPERGQTWEFDSTWRREKGRWKVFNAEWREGL